MRDTGRRAPRRGIMLGGGGLPGSGAETEERWSAMETTDRTRLRPGSSASSRLALGAILVAMAGVGLVGYGILFLIRNFVGFTELGLSSQQVGGTPEQIRAFSPDLYEYVSHLHMAVSGLLIALGITVVALAWYGIRRGQNWALWTVLLSAVVALAVT